MMTSKSSSSFFILSGWKSYLFIKKRADGITHTSKVNGTEWGRKSNLLWSGQWEGSGQ